MSTQLYLVPLVQTTFPDLVDAQGNPITANVPEYSVNVGDPLYGVTYACMPLVGASLALIATDSNAALAAESDVFAFPANLDSEMTDADIATLTTVLQNANVPTDFLVAGITYQDCADTIGAIAQVLQQAAGAGTPIQLGSPSPSQGVGKIGGVGGSTPQNALLASAAQWTAPLILDSTGGGSAL
jgi:hypothetical protein